MNTTFNLTPCDNRKSFYGKAKVINDGNTIHLKSYETIVCKIVNGEFVRTWGGWSATTARHVNSFRVMYGLPCINKAEWVKMEVKR